MISQAFCPDALWNSSVTWVDSDPDFTECFKQTILIWVPCAFLSVFLPFDLYHRSKSRYADIPWSFLNISKFGTLFLLIFVTFYEMGMMLGLRDAVDVEVFDSQIVSVCVKAATFMFAGFLQAIHKIKGHVTSGLLFLFWLILVTFAIPQLYSEIRNYDHENHTPWTEFQFMNYIIYFTLISILLLLNCFADREPRTSMYSKTKVNNPSPEQRSSFLNQLFFHWFTHITRVGYRRPLTEDDMFDLNPENTSKELIPPFDKYFAQSVERGHLKREFVLKVFHLWNNSYIRVWLERRFDIWKNIKLNDVNAKELKTTDGSVLLATIKAYGLPFLHAGFLRLIFVGVLFMHPFLLDELINFTSVSPTATLWQGLVLTFGFFFITFFAGIIKGQYVYRTKLTALRIKTGLMSAIYRKALRMSVATKKHTTSGEMFNLMSVDAQRYSKLMNHLHEAWSGPVIFGIAFRLLYRILGVAVFAGLGVMILLIPISGVVLYSHLQKLQIDEMVVKDERVKSMNEILTGMKVLKLYAWEPTFENLVTRTRAKEMTVLKRIATLNAGSELRWSTGLLISVASYTTFVLLGGELTPNVAFVSVTLFNILKVPMATFPIIATNIIQVAVSLKRINKFMNSEEINPNNVTNNPSENALSIDDGNFTCGGESTTLKNINMKVKKEKLIALVGPVGCGKTSLLSTFLGEMEKISGTVNVDGRIAYVPQQAWIQNATVQDNILFGRPMNEQFYNKVIHACALTADLAMLPGGDQTEIGERGINLSGGQKQRVALARAVYSEADIYLLDDPLSAVDSHVGNHIFSNVFDENTGLLCGKSRLLVTHAAVYLRKVSEIFVMANGQITESGSYQELLTHKGAFPEFLSQHLQENDESAIGYKDVKLPKSNQISEKSRATEKSGKPGKEIEKGGNDKSRLIDEEKAASGSVGIAVYILYFKSIGVLVLVAVVAFNVLKHVSEVFSNIWLTQWSTDPRAINPDDVSWRNIYIRVYAALTVPQGVSVVVIGIIFWFGCLRAACGFHERLLHNVIRLPMSFFDTTPLGRILNRFSNDINVIDNELPNSMLNVVVIVFNVLAILVAISYSTPMFLVVVIPIAVSYYLIQIFFVSTARQLQRIESKTLSPIYNHFTETIAGQSSIRAYGGINRFVSQYHDRVDQNQKMMFPGMIAVCWLYVRIEMLGGVVVLFACLFAVLARDIINPATVGLSICYASQISFNLSKLVGMTADVERNIVAIERVNEYSSCEQEAAWKTVPVDPTWPQKGVIKFENFQVRYREGLDLVLRSINFSVKSQEKVGIVGRTGAGKSSLTLALFRIIEAAGGKIVIDDINIAEIGLHSLRSKLSIIPQDPVLFSGSLRMNIDPFKSYTDDAIWMALEQSHLKRFVKGLSEGLDYTVAESGENLSVGQRQLICLARALLRKTKILILDEATAAVDIETDELIQNTIRTHFSDCTILTIAHRLNTIMDSGRVIVLDQGQIAEYDTPKALLENKNSIFYSMAKDSQTTM